MKNVEILFNFPKVLQAKKSSAIKSRNIFFLYFWHINISCPPISMKQYAFLEIWMSDILETAKFAGN